MPACDLFNSGPTFRRMRNKGECAAATTGPPEEAVTTGRAGTLPRHSPRLRAAPPLGEGKAQRGQINDTSTSSARVSRAPEQHLHGSIDGPEQEAAASLTGAACQRTRGFSGRISAGFLGDTAAGWGNNFDQSCVRH